MISQWYNNTMKVKREIVQLVSGQYRAGVTVITKIENADRVRGFHFQVFETKEKANQAINNYLSSLIG
jgi:hypothetical protein